MQPIIFTEEERNALLLLLDIAVKHPTEGGLKISGTSEYFKQRLLAASPKPEEQAGDADTE